MADKTIGDLPAVTVGELPNVSEVTDDTLIPVEQDGAARHLTGGQFRAFGEAASEKYVETAVLAAKNAAESEKNAGKSAEAAAASALEAGNPPYVGENGNWYVWDLATGQFVDSGEPAIGPQGPIGPTGAGIYIGTEEPTDPDVDVWINPDGEVEPVYIDYISEELAKRGQLKPEFANSIEECTDITKLYVLPDGNIYAYMQNTESSDGTTNLNLQLGKIDTSTGAISDSSNYLHSDQIAIDDSKTYTLTVTDATCSAKVCYYDASGNYLSVADVLSAGTTGETGSASAVVPMLDGAAYFRLRVYCNYLAVDGYSDSVALAQANSVLSWQIDGETTNSWSSTGHAFVLADYEDRIVAVEDNVSMLKKVVAGDMAVYGIVDSENNIIMTGTLAAGSYTLKYLHDDGTETEIGTFTME